MIQLAYVPHTPRPTCMERQIIEYHEPTRTETGTIYYHKQYNACVDKYIEWTTFSSDASREVGTTIFVIVGLFVVVMLLLISNEDSDLPIPPYGY